MAKQLYTNNAVTILASGIDDDDTSLTVASGAGAKFPNPSGDDWFLVTLINRAGGVEGDWEIVKCTARSTDVLTIVRAQEGTLAQSWIAGTPVELRWTAGCTLDAANLTNTPAGNLAATTVQAALNELDTEKVALAGGTLSGGLTVSGEFIGDARTVFSGVNTSTATSSLVALSMRAGASDDTTTLGRCGTEYTIVAANTGRSFLTGQGDGVSINAPGAAGTINFTTNTSFALRASILANGNFQIGNPSSDTGDKLQVNGNVNLTGSGYALYVNDVKVVGARRTGWVAANGTATRTAFDTSTVTTAQLAQRVKALIDDLIAHGLIGAA